MNPKLVGTWFLVKNGGTDGEFSQDRMVTKAEGVIRSDVSEGSFEAIKSKSGWMSLDHEDDRFWSDEYEEVTPADFNALKLPKVTYENSPIEIEIMPSGNVYFY